MSDVRPHPRFRRRESGASWTAPLCFKLAQLRRSCTEVCDESCELGCHVERSCRKSKGIYSLVMLAASEVALSN